MLYIGILLSLLTLKLSHAAPGDDFNLANFYLEEPKNGDTISGDDLEDGFTNSYFYSSGDAMMFYVPTSGEDTYPRCELREQCKSGTNDFNWDLSDGTHQLTATYEIGTSTTADYFIIAQIHSKDGPGAPLLKIRYYEDDGYGAIRVEIKDDDSGDDETKTYKTESWAGNYITKVDKGEQFQIKIQVKDSKVKVWFNGDRMVYKNIEYWNKYLCYFKAGNYKTQKDSENVKSYVKIHSLSITHSNSASCQDIDDWDGFVVAEDSEGNTSLTTAGIIVVIMAVLIAIALCITAGYCYYKKKYLPSKGQATFKDTVDESNNNKQSGDTPMVEEEQQNQTQTEAYDMQEIEVDIEA